MASGAMTSAGTVLAISATLPATYDDTGFSALTYIVVGEITDIGEFGKAFNLVTHNPLGDRKTYKFKGSYNNGSVSLTMALVEDDAGQIAMKTAEGSDNSIAVKVTLQDGTIKYFTAKCMGLNIAVGSVDSITTATTTLEVDSDIVTG